MLLTTARDGIQKHRGALLEGSASSPSYISEHTYRLAQYIALAEDALSELEASLAKKESDSFAKYITQGKSPNAAKELLRRDFIDEKSEISKVTRLISSGWKLVSENQSRVKHLIAEATNQI